jgi:two-component system, NarL family, sensor histidine kinase DegS
MERLSANQELSLYRVAQEGITNAIRHGKPRKIEVTLDKDLDYIRLVICDNGRGINPEVLDQGLGLIGIRERVDLLNGNFVLDTTPGEGTQLKVEIPIKR